MNHDDRDNHDDDVRYVLTEQGMRFLAARAGVPPSTFGEHGAVTYMKEADQGHPERTVRHLEHTLGLNRFMVRLARDARAGGWRLAEWRNEAESTCRFVDESGRPAWIRQMLRDTRACIPKSHLVDSDPMPETFLSDSRSTVSASR